MKYFAQKIMNVSRVPRCPDMLLIACNSWVVHRCPSLAVEQPLPDLLFFRCPVRGPPPWRR